MAESERDFSEVVDEAVQRLENLWQTERDADLTTLVPPAESAAHQRVLVELIKVDQEHRWELAQRKRLEAYLLEWPELKQAPDLIRELLEAECYTQLCLGESVSIEQLRLRFPDHWQAIDLDEITRQLHATLGQKEGNAETTSSHLETMALRIQCPHCRNTIELIDDATPESVSCPSCGSRISLITESEDAWQHTIHGSPTIAHFRPLSLLGKGAFGSVWKAYDTTLDRIVAVKIPRRGQLPVSSVDQFLREARAAARLKHPHIVPVHEVGLDKDLVYIVSDFIDGTPLDRLMKKQRLSFRETGKICELVANALQHAHNHGVIHRDLKPANIMIDSDNLPHLMDFGLAKRDASEITMTMDGRIIGTPVYMSPEQAIGHSHLSDQRTDIYGLGIVLFEMLTGELPFRGGIYDVLRQIAEADPPTPRDLNGRVPADLEAICLKCIQKTPSKRYSSAQELAADFRRYLSGDRTHARPTTRGYRFLRRLTRPLGRSALWRMRLEEECHRAQRALEREQSAREFAELERQRAQRHRYRARVASYAGSIREIERALAAHDFGVAEALLEECPWDLRGWEHNFLWSRLWQSVIILQGHYFDVDCSAFSPDGSRIVSAGNSLGSPNSEVCLWDIATRKELAGISKERAHVNSVAFSPDGKQIVVHCRVFDERNNLSRRGSPAKQPKTVVELIDVATWELTNSIETSGTSRNAVFSPDGEHIVAGNRVWNVDGREVMRLFSEVDNGYVACRPTGGQIATHEPNGRVIIRSAVTGEQQLTVGGEVHWIRSLRYSSDGKYILSVFKRREGDERSKISAWNADTGELFFEFDDEVLGAVFCRSSEHFVSWGGPHFGESSIKVWDLHSLDVIQEFKGHISHVNCVDVSPDGSWLVSGGRDRTLRIWRLDDSARSRVFICEDGRHATIHPSPGGDFIASSNKERLVVRKASSGDKILEIAEDAIFRWSRDGARAVIKWGNRAPIIWSATTGARVELTLTPGEKISSAAFSPDGKSIAVGGPSGLFAIVNADNGTTSIAIPGKGEAVGSICYSPDGSKIASVENFSRDSGVLTMRDATSADIIFKKEVAGAVYSLSFHPTREELAIAVYHFSRIPHHIFESQTSSFGNCDIQFRDTRNGDLINEFDPQIELVRDITYSQDGRRIISAGGGKSDRGLVTIWDATSGLRIMNLHEDPGMMAGVTLAPDNSALSAVSIDDRACHVWDATQRSHAVVIRGHSRAVQCVAVSANGKWIASGDISGVLKVWDSKTAEELYCLRSERIKRIMSLDFIPNSSRIAFIDENAVYICSIHGEPRLNMVQEHSRSAFCMSISPDGRRIATGSDQGINLYDVDSGRQLVPIPTPSNTYAIAFSPDGKHLVSAGQVNDHESPQHEESVLVWQADTGKLLKSLRGHSADVVTVEFSPDGKHIVSGSWDNTLIVWHAETGRYLSRLQGHGGPVEAATYSRDGNWIASASQDEHVFLWDAQSGKLVAKLEGHKDTVEDVAFGPVGNWLVSASNDRTVRIWHRPW